MIDRASTIVPEFTCSTFPVPLKHDANASALLDDASGVVGHVQPRTLEVLTTLEKDLELQLFIDSIPMPPTGPTSGRINNRTKKERIPPYDLTVCAVLYGPAKLFEKVGVFMKKCNIYLQHPKHCNRNVPYLNPHYLSRDSNEVLYTDSLFDALKINVPEPQGLANPIDLFADSVEQDILPETDSPALLKTNLYKHQKQALTFMLEREKGWAMTGHHKDIWREELDTFGRTVYTNGITGQKQLKKPKEFRGGLLTDNPGLGKSLCMIALIANSKDIQQPTATSGSFCAATLLVVPKTCEWRLVRTCPAY